MKKYIYLAIAVLSLAACGREEKNLFDKSAAERVEAAQNELQETLISSVNGWEMLYFPHEEAAGYAFLMAFEKNGAVTIAAKNSITTSTLYKEETSAWGTDGTQGATLCFTTFNTIFHKFADPGSDGLGYQGDYEFVCLKTTENQILLKGKKHGAYITMNRLSENTDWKAYFKQIDDLNEKAFLGNDGIDMTYVYGNSELTVAYKDGTFTYKKGEEEISRGFILTPSGVHFYTGIPFEGDTTVFVQDFEITNERIQSVKDPEHYYIRSNYDGAGFFDYKFVKKNRWVYTAELSDQATKNAVLDLHDKLYVQGAEISSIAYERYSTEGNGRPTFTNALHINYLVEGKLFEGQLLLNYSNKDGVVTYSYKNSTESIKPLLARIDADEEKAAKQITDIFCGTFTPETAGSKLNMNKIYLKGNRTIGVTIDNQLQ